MEQNQLIDCGLSYFNCIQDEDMFNVIRLAFLLENGFTIKTIHCYCDSSLELFYKGYWLTSKKISDTKKYEKLLSDAQEKIKLTSTLN